MTNILISPVQSPWWWCEEKFRDGESDGPWRCRQFTVPGNNSLLFVWLWLKKSRLRASIPDTFPLFPPSFLRILHLSHNSPCLPNCLLTLHYFSLCFGRRRSKKSRLLVTGTVLLWSWVLKKIVALSREEQTRTPLCGSWRGVGSEKTQKDERTGGWVQSQPMLKPVNDRKYSEAQDFWWIKLLREGPNMPKLMLYSHFVG